MKKKRTIGICLLFVFCFAVGLMLVLQGKMSNGQHLYVSAKVLQDYQTTINSEKKENEKMYKLIEEAEDKLKEYAVLAEHSDDNLAKKLKDEVDHYALISGSVAVEGEGVIVTVDDATRDLYEGESVNNILVHDLDILTIINELKRAGAEAICINGQRIADNTAVSCSGYTVRINGQFYARPFEIKAVGDSKRMAAVLIGPEGYGTYLQEYVQFKVAIQEKVRIPAFSEPRNYSYMSKAVKEGETN